MDDYVKNSDLKKKIGRLLVMCLLVEFLCIILLKLVNAPSPKSFINEATEQNYTASHISLKIIPTIYFITPPPTHPN
jgi:hypothetical protein